MKPSKNTLDALANLNEVRTQGDLRRIVANALLALARKEISATDVEAMAKGLDSISNSINVEIKVARTRAELRETGVQIGKQVQLGQLLIGNEESPDTSPPTGDRT